MAKLVTIHDKKVAPKRHHRLPIIGRPFVQRDEARRQRDQAVREREEARRERDEARERQGEVEGKLAEARRERDEARKELDILRARMAPHFHLEQIGGNFAFGWVFADSAPITRVLAKRDGRTIAVTSSFLTRRDVAAHHPHSRNAGQSGFELFFDLPNASDLSRVRIFADQGGTEFLLGEGLTVDPYVFEQQLSQRPCEVRSSYPAIIGNTSRIIYGASPIDIEKVCNILTIYDLRAVKPISEYVRFLMSCWGHFNFVDRSFPTANKNSEPGKKDYYSKANSPFEMMSIAHHLYVLKSYGVEGAFAEFGCFKGFSSAMLSYACSLLGIQMHIYDSFEGLPEPGAQYEKGEFSGSLEEVRKNIAQFGAIDSVVFHKGFFSDSLKEEMPPPLACLWMDVDLASSARDAIAAARMLSPLGAIFSHECFAQDFSDPMPHRGAEEPGDVIPAILSYYECEASACNGLFIWGHTGAFWRAEKGIPVLPANDLRRLLQLFETPPRI